ncbi:hypothetical protein DRB96_10710 [Streptomyces sp. ICC1]|nr:hypothetical protein DRB89_11845 [Streptomyces sp. ICC4]AWZ12715.1 hypothetical protein DRB96_10710 [Streptomyces sp. ICC1]
MPSHGGRATPGPTVQSPVWGPPAATVHSRTAFFETLGDRRNSARSYATAAAALAARLVEDLDFALRGCPSGPSRAREWPP